MLPSDHPGLLRVLGEAQRVGALGSAPLSQIIEHANEFAMSLPTAVSTCVDLGSGAGVPGLVIAVARPEIHLTLVDRRAARTDALSRAVHILGIEDQVDVVCAEVKELRSSRQYAHRFDAACCRGFGPPEVTLRWAVDFVREGGTVLISEPPLGTPDRWSGLDLAAIGVSTPLRMGAVALFHVEHGSEDLSPI